jgi:uncharacterized protein (DUF4415 family)
MSRNMIKTRSGREFVLPSDEEDAIITAAALADPDAQPMTDEQAARMRPAREVLPPEFFGAIKRLKPSRGGRPKSDAPKVFTGIRFDPDVLAGLRATGKGWQTRVNEVMREWVKARPAG